MNGRVRGDRRARASGRQVRREGEHPIFQRASVILKFLVGIIISLCLDFGALLWMITLITDYRYFSYALLVLFALTLVLLTLLYYFLFKFEDIMELGRRFKGFLCVFNVILAFLVLVSIGLIIIQLTIGLPFQANLAHVASSFFSKWFDSRQDEAIDALSEAISCNEKEPLYYAERGDLYMELYETLTETGASMDEITQMYGLSGDECLQNAIVDYNNAILLEQDNAEYRYKRGKALLRRGVDFDEAISDIRGAVKMEEGNALYNFECAKILMDYGDGSLETNREAKEYLERAIDEIEDKSEFYLYYARVLVNLESEEVQLPVSSFIKAISITDQDSHLRGTSNTELEEYLKSHREIGGEIIYELDEAIKNDEDNLNLIYTRGCIRHARQEYESAINDFNTVIAAEPLYFDAYISRSLSYNKIENYEAAVEDITIVLYHSNLLEYYIYRGDYLYNNEDYAKAIEDYRFAAEGGSNKSAYCYYSCGQACYRQGEYEDAAIYYSNALSEGLDDGYKQSCYRELGDVYLCRGDQYQYVDEGIEQNLEMAFGYYRDAIDQYQSALNYMGTDNEKAASCEFWIGNAYSRLGEDENALSHYEAACEMSDDTYYRDEMEGCRERLGW